MQFAYQHGKPTDNALYTLTHTIDKYFEETLNIQNTSKSNYFK